MPTITTHISRTADQERIHRDLYRLALERARERLNYAESVLAAYDERWRSR
jgi:hypothetical protein